MCVHTAESPWMIMENAAKDNRLLKIGKEHVRLISYLTKSAFNIIPFLKLTNGFFGGWWLSRELPLSSSSDATSNPILNPGAGIQSHTTPG